MELLLNISDVRIFGIGAVELHTNRQGPLLIGLGNIDGRARNPYFIFIYFSLSTNLCDILKTI
jgi:hypothetical protein